MENQSKFTIESKIFGASARAWIALLLIATTCIMSYLQIEVVEPLRGLVAFAGGFFFGQKGNK